MLSSRSILFFFTLFALLPRGAQAEPTPAPTPGVSNQFLRGNAGDIRTTNCNSTTSTPPGLCQPAPACNGGAGPNPDNIQASVELCEASATNSLGGGPRLGTLVGSGTGTGFRPGVTYISLIYLNGNTATCSRFPFGVPATLQNLPRADSDFASMFLGFWKVDANGVGTLTVAKQATLLGLNNYGSISVRETQLPNVACYDCGNDPAPQFNALRACGTLTVGPSQPCL